jgi:hypothetical protein
VRVTVQSLIRARAWELLASVGALTPFVAMHSIVSGEPLYSVALAPITALSLVVFFFSIFLYAPLASVAQYAVGRLFRSKFGSAVVPAVVAALEGSWIISSWSNPISHQHIVWFAMIAMALAILSVGIWHTAIYPRAQANP